MVGHPGRQTDNTYCHYIYTYLAISLQGIKHKKFSQRFIRGHAWGCLLLHFFFGISGKGWKIIVMLTPERLSR